MIPVKSLIFWTTIVCMFSDSLFITVGVNLYLYEVVLLINLVLLAIYGWLWIPPKVLALLGCLIASGLVGIVAGTDATAGFVKEMVGIIPNAMFAPSFLRMMNFDVKRCFRAYARVAFYVAAFGILYMPFQRSLHGRLTSIMQEPASFCVVCLPAVYYYADQWQRERRYAFRCIVLLVAVILTLSSQGFLGLLFGLCLFSARFRRVRVIVPLVALGLGSAIYSASSDFQMRLDDSVAGLASGGLERGTNLSSFGVMVNFFITEQQFEQHPIVGGGLGSHEVTYDRFYETVPGVYGMYETFRGLGRMEANSLFLRIISEFGLVGLTFACWFLWHYWPRGGDAEQRAIAAALLCYLLLKALRSGGYFGPEEFVFFTMYVVNGMPQRIRAREQARGPVLLQSATA